jgi:hypothetical protein
MINHNLLFSFVVFFKYVLRTKIEIYSIGIWGENDPINGKKTHILFLAPGVRRLNHRRKCSNLLKEIFSNVARVSGGGNCEAILDGAE